jgi:hypothetical protein
MSLIRVKIAELESRATSRKPGYVAAFKAAATPDPDGQHLLIDPQKLNELLARYADILDISRACCDG